MARVRSRLTRAAGTDVPVLLTGETGTGKTLAARFLHHGSRRRGRDFVALNCAGIPAALFESELFGHERGAFTGAVGRRVGLFEAAHQGTLFLDELGELPLGQQAKLLTVLDDGAVRRVGGERSRRVDVRLISATARDLVEGSRTGEFRADLYHRVAVVRIRIPPLRERPDDIPILVRHFLARLSDRHRTEAPGLTPDGLRFLRGHAWPGNLRELLHVLEAALVLRRDATLDERGLREVIVELDGRPSQGGTDPAAEGTRGSPGRYSFFGSGEAERERIREALVRCRGNKTRAARLLGMSRTTLRTKARRYGLEARPADRPGRAGSRGSPYREAPGEGSGRPD
jgi:DNA-binding NtrC family response regulator